MLGLQVLEEVDDLGLDGHVQGGDGLVRHQELGAHAQGPGDGGPLPLSAGELRGPLVQTAGVHAHAFELEGRLRPEGAPGGADAVDDQGLGDDLRHGHPGVEAGGGVLEDDLPGGLQQLPVGAELPGVAGVDPQVPDLPGGGAEDVHNALGRRGLPGPGFPHQSENLPPAQLEGYPIQGPQGPVPAQPEAVGQVLYVQ